MWKVQVEGCVMGTDLVKPNGAGYVKSTVKDPSNRYC